MKKNNNKLKKQKLIFELKRKLIHISALTYILIYYLFLKIWSHSVAIIILLFILVIILILEYFRIIKKSKIPFLHKFWRKKEKNKLGGQVYFIIGVILSFLLFDLKIAITAILMTIFGDMAAAIFGISFGKHWLKKFPKRSWEGIIAEFAIDLFIALLILKNPLISISMALIATLVETTIKIDDNLSIPVLSGLVGHLIKNIVK